MLILKRLLKLCFACERTLRLSSAGSFTDDLSRDWKRISVYQVHEFENFCCSIEERRSTHFRSDHLPPVDLSGLLKD